MDGQDVIGHLMDVEREAASLLSDAQKEADRRKTVQSEASSRSFKEAYERFIADQELRLAEGKAEIDCARDEELAAFQKRIESLPMDRASFENYLASVFTGA